MMDDLVNELRDDAEQAVEAGNAASSIRHSVDDQLGWRAADALEKLGEEIASLTAEIGLLTEVANAAELVRKIAHVKGFEGQNECKAHNDLVVALHEAGIACSVQPLQTKGTLCPDCGLEFGGELLEHDCVTEKN